MKGLPQLDATWFPSQLFWLALTFVTLYLVLSRSILPRIGGVLAARQAKREGDLDIAARLKTEALHAKEHYESSLASARDQASRLLAETMANVKQLTEDKSRELDATLAAKIATSEKQIDEAQQQAMGKLLPIAGEVTGMILELLLHKKVDKAQITAALKQSGSGAAQ